MIHWQPHPQRSKTTQMHAFIEAVNQKFELSLKDYWSLHRWSIDYPNEFWGFLSEFSQIKWLKKYESVLTTSERFAQSRWFVGAQLNYAQNLLEVGSSDQDVVVVEVVESIQEPIKYTRKQLKDDVAKLQTYMLAHNIKKGDRVVAVVSNSYFAVVGLLATAGLGAIWSSCSPDFGLTALLDRFVQLEPKLMLYSDSYSYQGKFFELKSKITQLSQSCKNLEAVLNDNDFWTLPPSKQEIHYESCEFDDPLYILFSSGTTGKPKCIMHAHGRALLQHKKELQLHCDLRSRETLFYFTTCGWMMWNWQLSALAVGAKILCWDGSPAYPNLERLWSVLNEYKVEVFGTSPKYLKMLEQQNFSPKSKYRLQYLKALLSTGSPLMPEQFDWVYQNIKEDLHLASISGGTDLVSCFMLGCPLLPVYSGELQVAGLGMAVEVWSAEGKKLSIGQKGELVCTKPFVSMPIGFWGDASANIYQKAYFHRFQKIADVWHHGDFISITENKGYKVFGRSDSTLNPGGVRIGTAEIYRVLESIPEIADTLAASYQFKEEVEIILFVKTQSNFSLEQWIHLENTIKQNIRTQLSPRHVPSRIFQVKDIPYTRSGKKVESSIAAILREEEVVNREALLNPEVLDEYEQIAKAIKVGGKI